MYKKLVAMMSPAEPKEVDEVKVFSQIWRSLAPSKVVAFSWKVLLNRIPTRINLSRRNVVPSNCIVKLCVMWSGRGNPFVFALRGGEAHLGGVDVAGSREFHNAS